jgi:gliding motility-associated-like protein
MQNSGSINFDSTNKYFDTGSNGYFTKSNGSNIPVGNQSYSIGLFVTLPNWGNEDLGLLTIGGFGSTNLSNAFRTLGNGLRHYWWNNDLDISNVAVTNQWVYLIAQFDGVTRSLWMNGVQIASDTPSGHNVQNSDIRISQGYNSGYYQKGKIKFASIYNRALSSDEIILNYNSLNPTISNSYKSTTSVDEESALGTLVGNLTATDSDTTSFTFSLVSGNGSNDQHNLSFTISGTQLLVGGNIDYETTPTLNIYVQASDGTNTLAKALTVNVNDINEPPVITATTLSNDNSSISVTFSEAVNASADVSNTLALEVSDFGLSINGGTATLSSTTPTSISVNGNTYTLGLPISGAINGSETVTVVPIINSIYDSGATTASTTQSNNTVILHGDTDSDGVNDVLDQCPNTPGGASVDVNGCAESQKDPDNDGISGMNDNCPNTANSNQTDTDGDGLGDACDPDIDDDGIANGLDNCPYDYNPDQKDSDTDGMGDLCDRDNDNDGYDDGADSFPFDPTEWFDSDNDGIGNNADTDDDNDGVEDKKDAFPLDDTENLDTDKDGIGNNADQDDDGDGYSDLDEITCNTDPLKRSSRPDDYDRDLSPDCIDTDDDNDGCLDQEDLFPFNERECIDTDGDGIGDNADMDADNDGIIDPLDDFPTDPNESKDTDGDGIGDNADLDDNNDGFPEDPIINDFDEEVIPIFVSELLTPNQTGEESTWRIVNIDKYPSANVKVYSPSGIIVYESWDYKNDWDGSGKDGKPLPSGPYYYRIDRGNETTVEDGWLYIFN